MPRRRTGMRLRSANAVSSGGVLYRPAERKRYQVALVGRSAHGTWGLPKGTPSEGESLEQTALREVTEETGIQPRLVAHLGSIQYYFVARNTRFHKIVHFYLMEAIGGDVSQHDHEYDLVEWFDLDEAVERLSYPNEVEMVRMARSRLLGNGAAS
jgi:ADP-ribose pyrophosphatase YjhB (NUDIX family)